MIVKEGGCVWYWVRYGRVELISVGLVSKAVMVRIVNSTDFGIRRTLLQIVLGVFATSFSGNEHVDCNGLWMWNC